MTRRHRPHTRHCSRSGSATRGASRPTGYGTECSGDPIGPGSTLDVPITGVDGPAGQSVPADAQAVVLNVTAISGTATTYLTVFPAGSLRPMPPTST